MAHGQQAGSGGFDAALPASAAARLVWRSAAARSSRSFRAATASAQRFGASIIAGFQQWPDETASRGVSLAATRPMTVVPRRVERDPWPQFDPRVAFASFSAGPAAAPASLSRPTRSPQYEHLVADSAAPSLPPWHQRAEVQMPAGNSPVVASTPIRRTEAFTLRPVAAVSEGDPDRSARQAASRAEDPASTDVAQPAASRPRELHRVVEELPRLAAMPAALEMTVRTPEPSSGERFVRKVSSLVRPADASRQNLSVVRRDLPATPAEHWVVAPGLPDSPRGSSATPHGSADLRADDGPSHARSSRESASAPSAIARLIERTVRPEPLPNLRFRLLSPPADDAGREPSKNSFVEPERSRTPAEAPVPLREEREDAKRTEPRQADKPYRRPAAVPQIDIGAVADQVFRMLQRRQRFERERRGLY
jgi:hypothetical protein